jgi:hypothetical protein
MFPAKKEISMKRNAEIMGKLMQDATESHETVSLRKFIEINFKAFIQSGKSTRYIYEFLKGEGIDVSSFQVFKSLYSKVKKAWKQKITASAKFSALIESSSDLQESPMPCEAPKKSHLKRSALADHNTKQSKYNPALPPVILPGGIEAIIDPETGAKRFEIKSERE